MRRSTVLMTRPSPKEEEQKTRPIPFFQLFRYSTPRDKLYLFLGTVAAFISSICMPLLNILFGEMAELMVELEKDKLHCVNGSIVVVKKSSASSSTRVEMKKFLDNISFLILCLTIAGLVQLIFGYLMIMIFNRAAERQIFRIRKLYLKSLLRQNVGWYDTVQDRNFVSRMSEDMVKVQDAMGEKFGLCVFYFFNSCVCLVLAFYYGWLLTLVILASAPLIATVTILMAYFQSKLTVTEQRAYGISGAACQEALTNIKTVMAFGAQHKEIERYEKNLGFARSAGTIRGVVNATGNGLLWFLNYATYSLAFWYGTKLIYDDQNNMCTRPPLYGTAALLAVFFNILTGSFNIGESLAFLETFSIGRGAAGNIFPVIDRVPEIDSYSKEGMKPGERAVGKIEFRDIYFAYPSRPDVLVLNGFNLTVQPGTTVALVGSSGNGKSTILQLLQRFYDPTQGSIHVDGRDIRSLNLAWLRKNIGVVGQEPVLFNTTIAENIRYGREGVSQAEIEEACRRSSALPFILKLPKKFETVVGDRGSQLSGGQKQRIAIARSFVKNPPILILDEATSALDTQTEKVVQIALENASEGRTTLIVAHRLSTIRAADLIVSIENGKVVEMGTHYELLAQKGLYYELVLSQSGRNSKDDTNISDKQSTLSMPMSEAPSTQSLLEDSELPTGEEDQLAYEKKLEVDEELRRNKDVKFLLCRLIKLNGREWPWILVGLLMSIAHGFVLPTYAFYFGEFMGVLSLTDSQEAREGANHYAIVFLFIGFGAGVTIFGAMLCFTFAGEALTNRLRKMAFTVMMKQSSAWYDNPANSTGALCTRLSADAASVQGATGGRLGIIVQAFTTIIISCALSLFVLPQLGAVAMSFVPLIIIATFYSGKMVEAQQTEEKKATEEASKLAYQAVTNIRTVASLGKEIAFVDMYVETLRKPHLKALRQSHVYGLVYGVAESLVYFAYAATMYYGGILIRDQGVQYTKIFIVEEALVWTMLMLGQTLAYAPNYSKAKVAGIRILHLVESKPEMDLSPDSGLKMNSCRGRIAFENVDFSYPTRPMSKILKGLSFIIEPHMNLGICGPSGSGKSTCVQLILRFYDPTTGKVRVDDMDVSKININALRSHIAIVAQEPSLFDRTLAENIAYGDNSREVPMKDVIQAARAANIHDFISSLPGGYETMVGQMGSQLSGGQKQRIAIARSLVRNPSILLLDEATSALDTESEKIVQATLEAASSGRTSLTIAHRLSSIKNCDKILVVHNGELRESGTHDELLEIRGIYFNLWNMQGHEKLE